ncbi:MAG: nicotinate phosphoribosyltransferase [Calditrichia bacterium]
MKTSQLRPLFPQELVVDLYELTMAAGYFSNQYNHLATFELFVREMPPHRSFLVAAGLQQVVEYLLNLKFTADDLEYLQGLEDFKHVDPSFWDYLAKFRFSGDLWAIPEGQIVFPGEPLLRVTAPIIEAQVIETFILSTINFQTMIASKAARVVQAAQSDGKFRGVMEFGSRRAHGPEASILAARASYIAGCVGTSNVFAGKHFHIPVYGTAAHSWTMAFPSEMEAFRAYHRVFPHKTTLLIDTYDVEKAAHKAVQIGPSLKGVRIDSGDLLKESRLVRKILDEAGMEQVKIILSGDLNEYKIRMLIEGGAAVDSFGVGTQMATSEDAPSLGGIYKLVEQEVHGEIRYRAKFSPNKATYPGKKQVYRMIAANGQFIRDIIGTPEEKISGDHFPLLVPILKAGKLVGDLPEIDHIRQSFFTNIQKLPEIYQRFDNPETYPVLYSETLQNLFQTLKREAESGKEGNF